MSAKYIPDPQLIFSEKPITQPAQLVFGETGAVDIPDSVMTLSGDIDEFVFNASIVTVTDIALNISVDDFVFNAAGKYISDCDRPVTAKLESIYSIASSLSSSQTETMHAMRHDQIVTADFCNNAKSQLAAIVSAYKSLLNKHTESDIAWTDAESVRSIRQSIFHDLIRIRLGVTEQHHDASAMRADCRISYVDRERSRASHVMVWQSALHWIIQNSHQICDARTVRSVLNSCYENAGAPKVGRSVDIPIKPPVVYKPDANLVFIEPYKYSQNLVFGSVYVVPGSTIVVPIRRAYIVLNQVEVRRVDGNYLLPVVSMDMNIDMDSWAWSFSASLPSSALTYLQQSGNDPVILDAKINGKSYLLIAEKIQRNRQFGKAYIFVTGRGKSAVLSDPYAPIQNFNNATDRTAQQLMNDALTFNGISLGWSIDWKISDWLVPAGTWNLQGNYMSAVTTIANAVGAFVQPDANQQILHIRPRYPFKPWDTSLTMADVELPSAVIVTESIAWEDKPAYNAVYVSGTTDRGLLANVVRTGAGGNFSAQMVTDPLITDVVAARARGISILADTGRIANYSLSLPVLAETGIIEPGTVVKYVDNDAVLGVVKSVAVTANSPSLKQTIEVQVHG